jgi:hypothetical protein
MTKGSSMPPQAGQASPEPRPAPVKAALFRLQALQNTWLKRSTAAAAELPEDQKLAVAAGKQLTVVASTEIPGNAHLVVELGSGEAQGKWHVFLPHFRTIQAASPALLNRLAPLRPGFLQPGLIDWTDFSALITSNLTVGEVLQFDARRRPAPQSSVIPRILETCLEFQAIRTAWGRPLGVTSFYRPEPINREVGGVLNSFHVSGLAMDIYPIGMPLQALYNYLISRWTGGFGDGRGRGFIHLDRRDGGRFVPGGGVRPVAIWPY